MTRLSLANVDADMEAAEGNLAKPCQLEAGLVDDLITGRIRVRAELELA